MSPSARPAKHRLDEGHCAQPHAADFRDCGKHNLPTAPPDFDHLPPASGSCLPSSVLHHHSAQSADLREWREPRLRSHLDDQEPLELLAPLKRPCNFALEIVVFVVSFGSG